ncbi:MAG: MFS transporter [Firmicutes bacterium]|nr:MFS transporter [Bacillota bacterium]
MESNPANSFYAQLDNSRTTRKHWTTVLVAGMGFFTDAYDLFIIGTVTVLLTPIFHLNTGQISLLNSASLLASVLGALTFGRLMDKLGRKKMYGLEVAILVLGAILSAFSWNFTSLFIFRLLVGYGVGGDYATSAVITSEYANTKSRGKLIGTVFAMQGLGLIVGPLMASIFLATSVPTDLVWRLLLGLGAIPAASVIYLRRKIKETPRFAYSQGDVVAAAKSMEWVTGKQIVVNPVSSHAIRKDTSSTKRDSFLSHKFLVRLIGTAGAWFLMDIAFYGNSVSSPLILKLVQPEGSLLSHTLIALAIFAVAALPGYWLAVFMLDKLGRRRIQWQGFMIMAMAFAAIWLIPGVSADVVPFLLLYALSYFFVEFGPNMTTFVLPAEIFPTKIRGTADGISAGAGKLGAFVGALMVPHMLVWIGVRGVMGVMAAVSFVGIFLTLACIPEPKLQALESLSGEDDDTALVSEEGSPGKNSLAGVGQ